MGFDKLRCKISGQSVRDCTGEAIYEDQLLEKRVIFFLSPLV